MTSATGWNVCCYTSPILKKRLRSWLYQIRLRYDKDDETELLIRVLSFGPVLEVIEPSAFVTLMRKRIAVQKQRFCQ